MNHDLFRILRRQMPAFLLVFSLGITVTVLIVLFAPRKYQSHAKLLIRLGRENVALDPTISTTGDTASLYRTSDSEVNTSLHTMASRNILEQVVDEVGVQPILRGSLEPSRKPLGVWGAAKGYLKSLVAQIDPIEDRERAILELQEGLKIEAERESRVVDVRYLTKTSELAQRVAQVWVKIYRSEHSRMNASEGSLEFFKEQEANLLDDLQAARETLQSRKSQFNLVTVTGQQRLLEHQMEWAKNSLIQSLSKLAASKARLTSLQSQSSQTDKKIVTSEATTDTNEARERMRDRLFALEIEERNLAMRYSREHPIYKATYEQLDEARRVFESQRDQASEITEGVNPLHLLMLEQLAQELANRDALVAEVEANSEILDELTHEFKTLNAHEAELAALERDVEVLELQFRNQFEKREQSRLALALEAHQVSNINVVQQPSLEERPASPNKKIVALLGLLGSLLAAVGTATLRESSFQAQAASEPVPEITHEPMPGRQISPQISASA